MCLVIELGSRLNRAKKDIICYKVVKVEGYRAAKLFKETITTPYQSTLISKEVINGEKPFIAKTYRGATVTDKMFEQYKPYFGEIKGRAVHTFATKIDAKAEADTLKVMTGDICRIYKCIIPKGTLYYNGFYEGKKSFASQKIVFKEAV